MNIIKLKKEDINKGYLILINPDYCLSCKVSNLTEFSNEFRNIRLESTTNKNLHLVLEKIKSKNQIIPISGYRTLQEQKDIYNVSLKENGIDYTKKFVALPNASEHQTGLAIDLALNKENIDFICPSFPYYGICQEFRAIAPDYGFIERYKEDKKNITKISNEEWHFRYVGYPHSKIITNNNYCLEEYILYLKQFTYPTNPLIFENYQIFYIPFHNENISLNLKKDFSLSGNNVDGFILTIKETKQ